MISIPEMLIYLFFIIAMFPSFHIICLIGLDELVTYISNKIRF